MSWLSKATGIHLGNIGAPVGAAIGSIVPGVGTSIGAALGQGLGALGQGKSVGQAAVQGAGAYGVGKLVGAIPGVNGAIKGAVEHIPGASSIESFLTNHPGLGSTIGGLVKGAGDFATGGGGANALGLAEILNAANLGKKSGEYGDKALAGVQGSYDERAPLRAAGQAGLLNPQTPDLSGIRSLANAGPDPTQTAQLTDLTRRSAAPAPMGLSQLLAKKPVAAPMPIGGAVS